MTSYFETLTTKVVATTEITPTSTEPKAIATSSTLLSTASPPVSQSSKLNATERVSVLLIHTYCVIFSSHLWRFDLHTISSKVEPKWTGLYLKHLVLDNFTELIFLPRTGEQDCLFSYFEKLHRSLTECCYF